MSAFRIILTLLIICYDVSAMQRLSKWAFLPQPLGSRSIFVLPPPLSHEFDPKKILTWEQANGLDVPVTNYKHIIAAPEGNISLSYGQGVKVAIIDVGLNLEQDHPFSLTPESKARFSDMGDALHPSQKYSMMQVINKEQTHTINICNIIAGPNGQGIAPKVQLDIFGLYLSEGWKNLNGERIAENVSMAIQNKNHFINMSIALSHRNRLEEPFFPSEGIICDSIIEAFLDAKKAGVGIILAAGNQKTNIIRRYPGFDTLLKDMAGSLLVVYGTTYEWRLGGAYRQSTLVEDRFHFSNDCDSYEIAKNGISAPSSGFLLMDDDGERSIQYGTSFAAPQVIAAAAILKGLHPYLTSKEIFDILKKTARNNPLFEEKYSKFRNIPGVLHIKNAINKANKNRQ